MPSSGRERAVCALTLAGQSRPGTALALGIAPSSVATLRARAYRRLGIHAAGELFALCLQPALAGPGPVRSGQVNAKGQERPPVKHLLP